MDRLCTEVVGLDGRGGAGLYASVGQWLTAYERETAEAVKAAEPPARRAATPAPKPRKLSWNEQQELGRMEADILSAEEAVAASQAEVERAATTGHAALADACRGWKRPSTPSNASTPVGRNWRPSASDFLASGRGRARPAK